MDEDEIMKAEAIGIGLSEEEAEDAVENWTDRPEYDEGGLPNE